MKEKKVKLLIVLVLILVLSVMLGGTYAWLMLTKTGTKTNVIQAGTFELILDDETSEGILITGESAQPISTSEGVTLKGYDFTVKNTGNFAASYTLYLDDVATKDGTESGEVITNRMADKYVRYSLNYTENNETALLTTTGSNPNRVLYQGTLKSGASKSFNLKLWIDADADNNVLGTTFAGQIRLVAEQVKGKNKKLAPGVYDINNNLIMSWDDLISNNYVVVNDNTISFGENRSELQALEGKLVIQEGITTIAQEAFSFTNFSEIVLPTSIVELGKLSFNNCKNLTKINFEDLTNLKTIGYGAFLTSGLTSAILSDSVESIGIAAFNGCKDLTTVKLSNKLQTISTAAFQSTNINKIKIPASVSTFADGVFANCNNLSQIEFEDGITSLPVGILYQNTINTKVIIPDSVVSFSKKTFQEANATIIYRNITYTDKTTFNNYLISNGYATEDVWT